jgi:hypothetical protein
MTGPHPPRGCEVANLQEVRSFMEGVVVAKSYVVCSEQSFGQSLLEVVPLGLAWSRTGQ